MESSCKFRLNLLKTSQATKEEENAVYAANGELNGIYTFFK
jgi:hypothetical protein